VSPNAVEPGTRLVDRYRLEEHLGAADGTTYWRAQDELLDRPVGLCLLPATEEQAEQAERVLRAARRAAVLTDARFLRVLDASQVDGVVYVVSEWVAATSLVDLLADGPLPPTEARDLALDIAAALDAAHQAGLAHLCLQPEHVLRTTHGQVKVGGLPIAAAVRGL
jgi:serine/threonine protein kinase